MNSGVSLRDEGSKGHPRLPNLPERLRGLERLSLNLWWSWQPHARELFRSLDHQAWRESNHNPVRMLALLPQEILQDAANDADFLQIYDLVMNEFEASIESETGWFTAEYGKPHSTMAYFSAEYAFHNSLKLYAGGLGVLAGDYIKECSDLAIPVVAVGLVYSRGYLSQKLRDDGWQEDEEKILDRTYDPVRQILDKDNQPLSVQVPVFDPPLRVQVWRGRQSGLGPFNHASPLHQRSRAAFAPGNRPRHGRNTSARSFRHSPWGCPY
jgi:starch phosphorylase